MEFSRKSYLQKLVRAYGHQCPIKIKQKQTKPFVLI